MNDAGYRGAGAFHPDVQRLRALPSFGFSEVPSVACGDSRGRQARGQIGNVALAGIHHPFSLPTLDTSDETIHNSFHDACIAFIQAWICSPASGE